MVSSKDALPSTWSVVCGLPDSGRMFSASWLLHDLSVNNQTLSPQPDGVLSSEGSMAVKLRLTVEDTGSRENPAGWGKVGH